MDNVKVRLEQYAKAKGISTYRLEKDAGMAKSSWSRTVNLSSSACQRLLYIYTDLSADWVFRGQGPMLRDNTQQEKPNTPESLWEELCNAITEEVKRRLNEDD